MNKYRITVGICFMFTIAVWIGYIVQAENNEDSKYMTM